MTSGKPLSKRVVLPSAIHALAGHEINIYFDTVVPNFNPYREYLEIKADIGTHLDARWNFFPDERDIGIHTVLIRLIDADDGSVITAETQVHVAKPTTGSGKEIAWLMIGDSLTHQSHYPERILDLCGSPGNPHIRLIGSHHLDGFSENNRHV